MSKDLGLANAITLVSQKLKDVDF